MEKITISSIDRTFLALAVVGLVFAVIPSLYIVSVDWALETITGKAYVDITIGLMTYVFALALLAIITVSYAINLCLRRKKSIKLSVVLFSLFIIQVTAVLVYSNAA